MVLRLAKPTVTRKTPEIKEGSARVKKEVNLKEGFIEIKAAKAKTASRRIVPVLPNLKKWLLPYAKAEGPVVPFANIPKQLAWLAKDSGVKWKQNGLRHSFISYRLAVIQDVAQVALEAGSSPQMILRHYRELVRPADANIWFAIRPPRNQRPCAKRASGWVAKKS